MSLEVRLWRVMKARNQPTPSGHPHTNSAAETYLWWLQVLDIDPVIRMQWPLSDKWWVVCHQVNAEKWQIEPSDRHMFLAYVGWLHSQDIVDIQTCSQVSCKPSNLSYKAYWSFRGVLYIKEFSLCKKKTFENSLCYCLLLISVVAGYNLGAAGETSTLTRQVRVIWNILVNTEQSVVALMATKNKF